MTPAEFRDRLAMLRMTQRGFARYVGHDKRTVTRWLSGETPIPELVARELGRMRPPKRPPRREGEARSERALGERHQAPELSSEPDREGCGMSSSADRPE